MITQAMSKPHVSTGPHPQFRPTLTGKHLRQVRANGQGPDQPNSLPPKKLEALEALFKAPSATPKDMKEPPATSKLTHLQEGFKLRQPFPTADLRDLISTSSKVSIQAGGDEFAIHEFLCNTITFLNLKLDLEANGSLVELIVERGSERFSAQEALGEVDGVQAAFFGQSTANNFHGNTLINGGTSHISLSKELSFGLSRLADRMGLTLTEHNAHQLCDRIAGMYLNLHELALEYPEDDLHLVAHHSNGTTESHGVKHLLH